MEVEAQKMKRIIATGNFGLMDIKDPLWKPKIEHRAFRQCSRFVVVNNKWFLFMNDPYHAILEVDKNFRPIRGHGLPGLSNWSQMHECRADNQGECFWVADTDSNRYLIINAKTLEIYDAFYPLPDEEAKKIAGKEKVKAAGINDINHFNSSFFHGSKAYFLAHNFWAKSHLFEFDRMDILEGHARLLKQWEFENGGMHGIEFIPDIGLVVGDSRRGSVIDMEGKEIVHVGGYLHGLTYHHPYLILLDNDKEDERNLRNQISTRLRIFENIRGKFEERANIKMPAKGGLFYATVIA